MQTTSDGVYVITTLSSAASECITRITGLGEPDIQMNDAPDSTSTSSTVMVSSFQRNLKVIRVERWVNWAKRSDAVAYLTLA